MKVSTLFPSLICRTLVSLKVVQRHVPLRTFCVSPTSSPPLFYREVKYLSARADVELTALMQEFDTLLSSWLNSTLSQLIFFLQALERRIKERGYHKIYLETATVLAEACKLYDSAGYLPVCGVETERCDQRRYKMIVQNSNTV